MQDDNELMAKVQDGDKGAYTEIVLRHRVLAISFAYSFLSDLQAAEDAVQDVFVKIYIDRDKYRPSYSFKTFLYQSIKNRCIDYLRKRKLDAVVSIEAVVEIADNYSIEDAIIREEYVNLVCTIIGNLQKDYKTALYLFSFEHMSYEEIAKIMHKTVPQIKITIFRARNKLKTILREEYSIEK